MRYIFQRTDRSAAIEDVLRVVNASDHDSKVEVNKKSTLSQSEVEQSLNGMMRDYQGEVILNKDGKPIYTFQRINNEVATASAVRSGQVQDKNLGKVFYDSKG